eukprot:5538457-Pyramimonas_sp.AAC.1
MGPSVGLPMGPRSAVLGWGDAGETRANCATGAFCGAPCGATKRFPGRGRRVRTAPLGLRWGSLWGHEA